ncbi:Na/Pi cotransporter family protein [Aestuariivirga sp.]|uniref:Na/Pi cotransporter family protein n=1 Tax=Aestuariivirga sp. TaxID=2650926 RepID=UPI0039E3A640
MPLLLLLIHLGAAVMLLLWAVRMVRTGVERAYGAGLRDAMRRARRGSAFMAMAGVVLAIVLQSATAVGVLAAGFAASGVISTAMGIAALLGADFGSALVVKILSFNLSELVPILILAGTTMFLKFENRMVRHYGRIVLGLGFILLSLRMIGQATEPLRESAVAPQIMAYLAGDPLTSFIAAAAIAWALHSSVATLLLLASFAGAGLLPVEAGLPMVLGANVGGAVIAAWLTRSAPLPARRIPAGNLVFRSIAAVICLGLLQVVPIPVTTLGSTPAVQFVNFHVAFNFVLMLLALPLTNVMSRLTEQLLPEPVDPIANRLAFRSALDRSVIGRPALALASAQRELLRMAETIEVMLRPVMDAFETGDHAHITRLQSLDQEINRRHTDIKLFIAEVNRGQLSEAEMRRGFELASLATDFEAIGDLIKTLLALAEEKAQRKVKFSEEGWRELISLHDRVMANIQMAMNVHVSGDLDSARQLAEEKTVMRKLERESQDKHLARLKAGQAESLETSDMHLEIVRALKEINSLIAKVAYPILKESGQLLDSRLAS